MEFNRIQSNQNSVFLQNLLRSEKGEDKNVETTTNTQENITKEVYFNTPANRKLGRVGKEKEETKN